MGEPTRSGPTGAQLLASVPPSKALEPSTFYSLYLGGLSFDDRQRRLRASAVLMLGGRLGLRPGEIQHLHEEWIDWGRGELTIPERDPCACQQCWETARHAQRAGDGRTLREILTESMWSPPGAGRTIPFAWSERLTAILARLCEAEEYLTLSAEAMGRLVERSASHAEGLDDEAIDFRSLRATAAMFFADAGFSPQRVGSLLGEEQAKMQRAGGDARQQLAALFGGSEADPGEDYTLLANPEPFDREPFDPQTYDAEWRQARAHSRSSKPERVRNPRPMSSSVEDVLDAADLGTRSYLDPESELVDETNAAVQLGRWVNGRDAERRAEISRAKTASQQSPAADHADPSPSDTTEGSVSQQSSASGGQSGSASAESASGASEQSQSPRPPREQSGAPPSAGEQSPTKNTTGGGEASRNGETASESPPTIDDASVFDPRDQLSGSPVVTVETTVACSAFADGQPTSARVFLGPQELLFVRNDDSMTPEHTRIELSAVVDQSLDHLPSQLEDAFESAVTLAYDEGDRQRLAIVELSGNRQRGFANAVFKQILSACRIVVTHPARRGGRVLNTAAAGGTLSVDDRSVSITVDDEDEADEGAFTIQLSDIIYFELEKQTFEEQRFRSLSVRHLDESGVAIKTTIAVRDERKHKLFQRFVRRGYRERKRKIEGLTLTEAYKEVLVALYSAGDEFNISMIIDKPADELQELLSSLGQVGLVRMSDNGAVLTGLGHVVVNEKIEDVNM
ncbi:MAG: CheF family chemotaxis protein [Euryarchaeota archaeon]|nr:CheF family chemotaxis protein [Euryarchaeota archaeon]